VVNPKPLTAALKAAQKDAGLAWESPSLRDALVLKVAADFIRLQDDPKYAAAQALIDQVLALAGGVK
jgi:hypothetical protein